MNPFARKNWFKKLEDERVEACVSDDALKYKMLSDFLGIEDIERPELYEQAQAEKIYHKKYM